MYVSISYLVEVLTLTMRKLFRDRWKLLQHDHREHELHGFARSDLRYLLITVGTMMVTFILKN